METSKSCKKIIETLSICFEQIEKNNEGIKAQNVLLNERVKTAEETLTQFKESLSKELERAYKEGYKAAIESTSGNVEGGKKLVQIKN